MAISKWLGAVIVLIAFIIAGRANAVEINDQVALTNTNHATTILIR